MLSFPVFSALVPFSRPRGLLFLAFFCHDAQKSEAHPFSFNRLPTLAVTRRVCGGQPPGCLPRQFFGRGINCAFPILKLRPSGNTEHPSQIKVPLSPLESALTDFTCVTSL